MVSGFWFLVAGCCNTYGRGFKGVKGDIYTKVWLGVGAYTAGKWADDNSWGSVYTCTLHKTIRLFLMLHANYNRYTRTPNLTSETYSSLAVLSCCAFIYSRRHPPPVSTVAATFE